MRLIDADALKEQFKDKSLEDFTYLHFIEAIDNSPTIESQPSSCILMEFGECSYKETGCSDCKIKSDLRYMCHSSAWQELQALRQFKEKHEKKGKWIECNPLVKEKYMLDGNEYFKCSECCYCVKKKHSFCPECGAEMR